MRSSIIWITVLATTIPLFISETDAWGGVFNRFSPEMLSNLGYGAHGSAYRQPFFQDENYLEDEQTSDDECYGRRCVANEHCCPGTVCVNVDGIIGNCLFAYGRKLGELCRRDADCESGLVCDVAASSGASVCRAPMVLAKQYAEDCHTSTDCDITRGLCCQLQRRHRQQPRKVCSYFKDPLVCIGTVAADQVKNDIEHTAGEKRIASYRHGMNTI
ncbi:prohormone-3 [Culicoides brevitarsis]|uniref:prohormone-3 n=1 Tax=Culicoides brevitarsis TaxID=469753 RepID=UPI00307C3BB5